MAKIIVKQQIVNNLVKLTSLRRSDIMIIEASYGVLNSYRKLYVSIFISYLNADAREMLEKISPSTLGTEDLIVIALESIDGFKIK